MKRFSKTTHGFVTQIFERSEETGPFHCTSQEFVCGDDCAYEGGEYNEELQGEAREDAQKNEVYQTYDMVQPGKDYYVLEIWGLVEPQLHGPFTKEEADKNMDTWPKEPENRENTYHLITLTKGVKIDF